MADFAGVVEPDIPIPADGRAVTPQSVEGTIVTPVGRAGNRDPVDVTEPSARERPVAGGEAGWGEGWSPTPRVRLFSTR